MDHNTMVMVNTLLILLIAILQFVLRQRPQTPDIQAFEQRLEETERRLEMILLILQGQAIQTEDQPTES